MKNVSSKKYAPWLWSLLSLFCFRVIAQLGLLVGDLPFLPPFEKWHSGMMPYEALSIGQLLIIAIGLNIAIIFTKGTIVPHPKIGWFLLVLGGSYLSIMIVRFFLGLTLFPRSRWFTNDLPIFFHIILALFILVVANFHSQTLQLRCSIGNLFKKLFAYSAYPLMLNLCLGLHL